MISSESDILSVSSYLSLDGNAGISDPCCNGCNLTIEGGSVVAFGGHIWHTKCFRCSKCNIQVNHNSNIFLSDGNPICEKCSYNCKTCNKHINGLAIMIDNDAYHSECFLCNVCGKKIEDPIFSKTHQKACCMSCYNNNNTLVQNKKIEKNFQLPISSQILNKSLPSIPDSSSLNELNSQIFGSTPVCLNKSVEKPYIDFSPSINTQTELLNINNLFPSFENEKSSESKNNPENSSSTWSSFVPSDFFSDFSKTTTSLETDNISKTENASNDNSSTSAIGVAVIPAETSIVPSDFENSLLLTSCKKLSNAKNVSQVKKHIEKKPTRELSKKSLRSKKSEKVYLSRTTSIRNVSFVGNNKDRYSMSFDNNLKNTELGSKKELLLSDFSFKETHGFDISMLTDKADSSFSYIIDKTSENSKNFYSESHNNHKDLNLTTLSKKVLHSSNNNFEPHKHSTKDFLPDKTNLNSLNSEISNVPSGIPNIEHSSFQLPPKDAFNYHDNHIKDYSIPEKPNSSQPYSKIFNIIRHKKSASESKRKTSKLSISLKHSRMHQSRQLQSSSMSLNNKLNEIIDNNEKNDVQRIISDSYQSKEFKAKMMNNQFLSLNKDILKGKELLVELDAKREIALQELKILKNQQLISQNDALSNEVFIANVISKLSVSLQSLKNNFQSEIEALILQRSALYEKNLQLQNLRDKMIEEINQLNFKKVELMDLNDKLIQKIQAQFRTYKGSGNISHVRANSLFRNENIKPLPPIITPVSKSSNNDNLNSISYIESVSTPVSEKIKMEYIESSNDNSLPKIPSKSEDRILDYKTSAWKKGTVLTKNFVKGFNNRSRLLENNDIHSDHGNNTLSSSLNNLALKDTLYSKNLRHVFSTYTFLRITKCDYCGTKLWGNEMRCLGCGIPCHIKCIGDIVTNCKKSIDFLPYHENISHEPNSLDLYVPTLFGNDLTKQAQTENRDIPFIVTKCINEVEKRGMFFEGLYRKSGSVSQMRLLIDAFNRNEVDNLSQSGFEDISVVTSVLKQYFRKLPNPLITYEVYKPFLEATVSDKPWMKKLESVKDVLSILPKIHYNCLKFLILHLNRVIKYSNKNLMSSRNLAVVFSPTLLRDKSGTQDITDIQAKNIAMQYLFDNATNIFGNSSRKEEHDDFA
ncbi:hypothetical protein PCANB_002924 [Pneumocystis canis]|nr:hypothetical protein PCANB_002924 [Pneumocystis canis]